MIHTESPLPWKYDEIRGRVTDANKETVMNSETYGAATVFMGDQQAIVTAVNCHNELLEALEHLHGVMLHADWEYLRDRDFPAMLKAQASIAKALNQQGTQ